LIANPLKFPAYEQLSKCLVNYGYISKSKTVFTVIINGNLFPKHEDTNANEVPSFLIWKLGMWDELFPDPPSQRQAGVLTVLPYAIIPIFPSLHFTQTNATYVIRIAVVTYII
jgi:hypothetical protein